MSPSFQVFDVAGASMLAFGGKRWEEREVFGCQEFSISRVFDFWSLIMVDSEVSDFGEH